MRGLTAAVSTVAAALAMSGCSIKNDNANLVAGKQLFVQKCGSCHVLDRAGTKGNVGPDLDEAFRQSKIDGLGDDAVRGVVKKQIEYPSMAGSKGTGIMPAGLVTGDQAQDVAAYVAQVAAEGGKDSGLLATAVKPAGSDKPAVESGGKLTIPADPNGQLAYVNKTATAKPGNVTITIENKSAVPHNIKIDGIGQTKVVTKGDASFQADLKPGKYTYFCTVPGHQAAGMEGTLTVK